MDRLDAMAVFAAAVETRSLSAAGRKLGMPLATVSRKLSELEAHLKTRLLLRSTRQLTLTEAGHAYLAACKQILEAVNEAEQAASGEYTTPRGELIITAPIVFGRLHVLPIVTEFLGAYPEVDARLHLGDRTLNLLDEHIDLAVRIGELPDSQLSATPVGEIRYVVCASPGYFSLRGKPQSPSELEAHQCIAFESLTSRNAWSFVVDGADVSVPITARLHVNTAEAAIDAAVAGFGITRVLSYQVSAAVQGGTIGIALEAFEPAPLPVNLVFDKQGRLPVKLRAFLDFATPRLRERLR
ncbi:MAG: LysR family transcriptional regulator [Gammaproteobacteria bacterium]